MSTILFYGISLQDDELFSSPGQWGRKQVLSAIGNLAKEVSDTFRKREWSKVGDESMKMIAAVIGTTNESEQIVDLGCTFGEYQWKGCCQRFFAVAESCQTVEDGYIEPNIPPREVIDEWDVRIRKASDIVATELRKWVVTPPALLAAPGWKIAIQDS